MRQKWSQRDIDLIIPTINEQKGDIDKVVRALSDKVGRPLTRAMIDGKLRHAGLPYLGDLLKAAKYGKGAAALKQPVGAEPLTAASYERRIEGLLKDLKDARARQLSDDLVKREIIGLKRLDRETPDWLIRPAKSAKRDPGVPTALLSDLHYNENVDPAQIEYANEYDCEIAEARIRKVFRGFVELPMEHMVNPRYPGIVLDLGGDNYSGDIHDELSATNEHQWGVAFLKLQGILLWGIRALASEYGRVHLNCVPGNHGRTTKKPIAKGYNYTNLDWLLYQELRLQTEDDERITWWVPDGTDAPYRVYGHRYLLTHGAQFRGGDGIIGPLGPLTRGDNKKRARNVALGSEYDTLVVGHFHRLMMLPTLIVNGSTKGYDEYAYQNNFPYERAQQALWFTHPEHGITISMPVFCDSDQRNAKSQAWIEVPAPPKKRAA